MSIDVTPIGARSLTERVAEEIRVLLTRRRMRQSQMARALGVSEQWLSVRLRGVQPIDLNDLERIADVLGVSFLDLIPGGTVHRSTTAQSLTSPQAAAHAVDVRSPRGIRSRRRLAGSVAA